MNTFWISLCVIAVTTVLSLDVSLEQHVHGIKNLVSSLPQHAFPTCGMVLFTELTNYETAEDKCRNFHLAASSQEEGWLVEVNDAEKNAYLTTLLNLALPRESHDSYQYATSRWVWTGLRKTNNIDEKHIKKVSKRIPYNAEDWKWHDGSSPTEYSNWNIGQPDQRPLKKNRKSSDYALAGTCPKKRCRQNHMRVDLDGKWDDAFDFEEHPYACDYKGRYIVSAELKTWDDAKAACEAAGLTLAAAKNPSETEELRSALVFFLGEGGYEGCFGAYGNGPSYVLGSSQTQCTGEQRWSPDHWAWVGGSDDAEEGNFIWQDGSQVVYDGFPWIAKAGGDNGKPKKKKGVLQPGQNSLTLSKWGEYDDEFGVVERPFACECSRG